MHILRSTYVFAFNSLIRPPYTSDCFSPAASVSSEISVLTPATRELPVLDLFIALLAREDLFLDATSLHLPRDELFKDIFDLIQPRSRLEDLVREEGLKVGVITVKGPTETSSEDVALNAPAQPLPDLTHVPVDPSLPGGTRPLSRPFVPPPSPTATAAPASPSKSSFSPFHKVVSTYRDLKAARKTPPPPTPFLDDAPPSSPLPNEGSTSTKPRPARITPILFSRLSVSFSPRVVKLLYSSASGDSSFSGSTFGSLSLSGLGARKKLVEISRGREEPLELSARRLVMGLREVLEEGSI